jgi:hypothetical protein
MQTVLSANHFINYAQQVVAELERHFHQAEARNGARLESKVG